MATPMYLIGTTDKSHQEPPSQIRPEPPKTRPKKSKNPNQKKQPQRGLGVAQLERLRLQERWRKMTGIMPPPPPPPPQHFQCHSPFLLDPNFPVHFAAAGAGQTVDGNIDGGGTLFPGFDCSHQGLVVQRMGNNGGFISGGLMAMEAYAHGGGAVDPRALIGNSFEAASRELSSIPKFPPPSPSPPPPPPCISDHCDICFKKKQFNTTNPAFPGAETASFDFLGLSTNSAAEFSSGGAIAPNHITDLGLSVNFNHPQGGGAEITQIHRRAAAAEEEAAMSSSSSGSILMEYEFFPGKNCRGAEFEDLKMPIEELQEDQEGSSCITTSYSTATDHHHHHIINGGMISSAAHLDLSLKLSF